MRQVVHGDTSARISDFQRAPRPVALACLRSLNHRRHVDDLVGALRLRKLDMLGRRSKACRGITTGESATLSISCICGISACLVAWLIEGQRRHAPDLLHESFALVRRTLGHFHDVLHDLGHAHPRTARRPFPSERCVPSTKHLGADPASPPTPTLSHLQWKKRQRRRRRWGQVGPRRHGIP